METWEGNHNNKITDWRQGAKKLHLNSNWGFFTTAHWLVFAPLIFTLPRFSSQGLRWGFIIAINPKYDHMWMFSEVLFRNREPNLAGILNNAPLVRQKSSIYKYEAYGLNWFWQQDVSTGVNSFIKIPFKPVENSESAIELAFCRFVKIIVKLVFYQEKIFCFIIEIIAY